MPSQNPWEDYKKRLDKEFDETYCFRCKSPNVKIEGCDATKGRIKYKCLACGNVGFRTIRSFGMVEGRCWICGKEKKAEEVTIDEIMEFIVCNDCKKEYKKCTCCGESFHPRYMLNDLCPFCFIPCEERLGIVKPSK